VKQLLFHGILVNISFIDREYPERFTLFDKKQAGDWILYGVEVTRSNLEETIADIQQHMRTDELFYNHLYDDEELIVIFPERVFRAQSHASSWGEIIDFGLASRIPAGQLDFWPNRFQDEKHYFS